MNDEMKRRHEHVAWRICGISIQMCGFWMSGLLLAPLLHMAAPDISMSTFIQVVSLLPFFVWCMALLPGMLYGGMGSVLVLLTLVGVLGGGLAGWTHWAATVIACCVSAYLLISERKRLAARADGQSSQEM